MSGGDWPDLSTRQLRAITALTRLGKFTAAAAELGMSQPGFSRLIAQAEHALGATLFQRGTRSVVPTAAGRAFSSAAERVLGELRQQARALRALDGELRGQMIIASLMSISYRVLPAALVEFRRQHPKMHIQIREGLAGAVLEDVRSGIADFGIGNPPDRGHEITLRSVSEERCYLVLPRGHRLARRRNIGVGDLAEEPMISMPATAGLRQVIDAAARHAGIALDHSLITNQYASLFDFVAKGLGASIVPASALPHSPGNTMSVHSLRPTLKRPVGTMHLSDRPLSPACTQFLSHFHPIFRAAIRGRR